MVDTLRPRIRTSPDARGIIPIIACATTTASVVVGMSRAVTRSGPIITEALFKGVHIEVPSE